MKRSRDFDTLLSDEILDAIPQIFLFRNALVAGWLYDVKEHYELTIHSFIFGVGILHQFMKTVGATEGCAGGAPGCRGGAPTEHDFQKFAITSLWIAQKYIESNNDLMTSYDCSDITASTYTRQEIIDAEIEILRALNWNILAYAGIEKYFDGTLPIKMEYLLVCSLFNRGTISSPDTTKQKFDKCLRIFKAKNKTEFDLFCREVPANIRDSYIKKMIF